jgi:CHAD domain-containing protein
MSHSGKWIEGIAADADVAEAARIALGDRLAAVAYWLPAAAYSADQDIEHVHRLRVSTRRATAAWRLFHNWLPPKRARRVKNWLKEIRDAAGPARDLDVLAERIKCELNDHTQPVLEEIARRREKLQPAIVRVAERARKRGRLARHAGKLLSGIKSCCNKNNCDECRPFKKWARKRLSELAADFFEDVPTGDDEPAKLHQFRIRAKALRYTIEIVAQILGPELRDEHYPLVEELQERLGRINDYAAAASQMEEWAEEGVESMRQPFREMAHQELQRLEAETREFHEWWTPEQIESLRRGLSSEARQRARTVLG